MPDEKILEQEHQMNLHNSQQNPVVGCPLCEDEVYRRSHKCFGDGRSSSPIPAKET